jgi:hypothetical protein
MPLQRLLRYISAGDRLGSLGLRFGLLVRVCSQINCFRLGAPSAVFAAARHHGIHGFLARMCSTLFTLTGGNRVCCLLFV